MVKVTRRHAWYTLCALATVTLLFLFLAPVSQASSPPQTLNGTFETVDRDVHSVKGTEHGNTIISYTPTVEFRGPISGTLVVLSKLILSPDGTFRAKGSGLFTGSIDGKVGTMLVEVGIHGVGPSGPTFYCYEGDATFRQGTGALKGVIVTGKLSNQLGAGGATYSLNAHFK